jgi:hypothetical protein
LFPFSPHIRSDGSAHHHQESQEEGEGDADLNGVSVQAQKLHGFMTFLPMHMLTCVHTATRRGLDNAGKTTIVKCLNGEDITTVSPTLGFNIKTLSFKG